MIISAKSLFSQQIISWIMTLILAISPIQVAMAAYINFDGEGEPCQMSMMQAEASSMKDHCALNHAGKCAHHLNCFSFNLSHVDLTSPLVINLPLLERSSWPLFDESLNSHYPQLLKRPPKA